MDAKPSWPAKAGRRAFIGAVSLFAAINAGIYAWGAVAAHGKPDQTLSFRPYDGIALTSKITREMEQNPQFVPSAKDRDAIANSLRSRPLNEGALRIMGSSFEAAGETRRALAAMELANRVSRHDLLNQMWLIEHAVQQDDIPTAVAHYHNALSVNEGAGVILYPLLANALVFPEVRNALRPYIAKPSRWAPTFLSVASVKADAGALKALILPIASKMRSEAYVSAIANLLYRLVRAGDVAGASVLAKALMPGFNLMTFSELQMTPQTTDKRLGLLGWSFPQTDSISSFLEEDGTLNFNVLPLARGAVAERDVIVVPHQTYSIAQLVASDSSGARAETDINIGCVNGNKVTPIVRKQILGRLADPTSSAQFSVPDNCSLIRFSITVRGPEGQMPSSVKISKLTLTKR